MVKDEIISPTEAIIQQQTALVNVPLSSIPIFLIMSVSHWFLHQPNEIPTTLLNIIDDLLILASLSWRQEFDWSAINSSAGIGIHITTVIKGSGAKMNRKWGGKSTLPRDSAVPSTYHVPYQ